MNLEKGILITNQKRQQLSIIKDVVLPEIFDTFSTGYMLMDIAGNILYINAHAKAILECDERIKYTNVRQLIHKKDFAWAMKSFVSLMGNGVHTNYSSCLHMKNGSRKNIRINASIIYNEAGKALAAHGTIVESI